MTRLHAEDRANGLQTRGAAAAVADGRKGVVFHLVGSMWG
jgi:hypothetical protein